MTDTPKKLIVDVTTGTQTYVDLTPEEIAQREADAVAAEAAKAEAEAKAAADAETRANAESKLAGLGLTAEEIAALSK
jgi:ATPase subunit of ABC transporter with duplicated ATPase domains